MCKFPARHAALIGLILHRHDGIAQAGSDFHPRKRSRRLARRRCCCKSSRKNFSNATSRSKRYHYNYWKQRELRERAAWVTDFTFEPRMDKPEWVVIDHHVTDAAPKNARAHPRREQIRRAALLRTLQGKWRRITRARPARAFEQRRRFVSGGRSRFCPRHAITRTSSKFTSSGICTRSSAATSKNCWIIRCSKSWPSNGASKTRSVLSGAKINVTRNQPDRRLRGHRRRQQQSHRPSTARTSRR